MGIVNIEIFLRILSRMNCQRKFVLDRVKKARKALFKTIAIEVKTIVMGRYIILSSTETKDEGF